MKVIDVLSPARRAALIFLDENLSLRFDMHLALLAVTGTATVELPSFCTRFVKKLEKQVLEVKKNRKHLTVNGIHEYAKMDFETIRKYIRETKKEADKYDIPDDDRACIEEMFRKIKTML